MTIHLTPPIRIVPPATALRHAPDTLRHVLRENQVAQIALCVGLGLGVGLITLMLHEAVLLGRRYAFSLQPGQRLSSAGPLDAMLTMSVPAIGGVILVAFSLLFRLIRRGETVDPIEANAIYGGRMSVIDSARLTLQAMISNIAGASIGMEAAYTQMGAALCSRIGRTIQLRRDDMRIFVAAGAAAAIAGAFNAPMAGAFYGFELVLGTYTITALPPVALAALSSALLLRSVNGAEPLFSLPLAITTLPMWEFPLFALMGAAAAGVGIATMMAVTQCEQFSRRAFLPAWTRPAIGGLAVSAIALFFPQVLGSGQGAIDLHLNEPSPLLVVAGLLAAKMAASAISLGMGFRGGLFSASLLIGCLLGQLSGLIAGLTLHAPSGQLEVFMLVGMGAVGTSIVGAPVTMVLLVLEMTGNYPVTAAVLVGVLVSSVVTRTCFGYSFSTWRFHVRGLRISGAHDIGWVGEITVESMMQQDPPVMPAATAIAAARRDLPPDSARRIYLVDLLGRYAGMVELAELHSHDLDARADTQTLQDIATAKDVCLLPGQDIRTALGLFAKAETEELPVVTTARDGVVIGALNEAYALKRYARELEARNLAQSGAATPTDPA